MKVYMDLYLFTTHVVSAGKPLLLISAKYRKITRFQKLVYILQYVISVGSLFETQSRNICSQSYFVYMIATGSLYIYIYICIHEFCSGFAFTVGVRVWNSTILQFKKQTDEPF